MSASPPPASADSHGALPPLEDMLPPAPVWRAELALVAITVLWGATFLIVHNAMKVSGPLFFVGLRFGVASLLTLPLLWRGLRGVTLRELVAGGSVGAMIAIGYGLQTWGLKTIPSSTSAFITAAYVPLVPLLQWVALRSPPGLMRWVGVVLAFIGLVLIARPDQPLGLGTGEILTLVSTFAIAVEIILISLWAGRVDMKRVTLVQLASASLLSFLCMPLAGEGVPHFSWLLAASACGLGAMSALIQLVMNWAQQRVSATRATLIYALEPVWAGVVGALAGEALGIGAIAGAGLIIAGVVVSQFGNKGAAPGH